MAIIFRYDNKRKRKFNKRNGKRKIVRTPSLWPCLHSSKSYFKRLPRSDNISPFNDRRWKSKHTEKLQRLQKPTRGRAAEGRSK